MIKVGERKWIPDSPLARAKAEKAKATAQLRSTVHKLKGGIAAGTAGEKGMTFREHVRLAKKVRGEHREQLQPLLDKLRDLAPNGTVVGRVKSLESILGKLARKPDVYKKASDLDDVTGTRIIHKTIDEVRETADKIRKHAVVVEEEDLITKPRGDYRSIHFIIRDKDGKTKELQVRTVNQDRFANWSHDYYKPTSPDQAKAIKANKKDLEAYSGVMSEFMYAQDLGKSPPPPEPPDCPAVVQSILGCL